MLDERSGLDAQPCDAHSWRSAGTRELPTESAATVAGGPLWASGKNVLYRQRPRLRLARPRDRRPVRRRVGRVSRRLEARSARGAMRPANAAGVAGVNEARRVASLRCCLAPFQIADFSSERRFRASPMQRIRGVRWDLICGSTGTCGVVGAYAREPGRFDADSANFMQSVSNTLAAFIERKAIEGSSDARRGNHAPGARGSRFALQRRCGCRGEWP
jgi:hypothetical protein